MCLVGMFSVVCCVSTWSSWKRRALGKDSRRCCSGENVLDLAGEQSGQPGRLQLVVTETTLRNTSRIQRQPNELPWDQRRLAKFGAIQKATELSVIPTSKDLSPRSQWEEERFVWKTVSFPFSLMRSLGFFCNLKAGLFIFFSYNLFLLQFERLLSSYILFL